MPTGTRPRSESVPVANFQTDPRGVPWAIETYQNRPSGETATLCGPSGSAGSTPTGIPRTFRHPAGPTSIRVTVSADSLETYRVYGTAAVGAAGAPGGGGGGPRRGAEQGRRCRQRGQRTRRLRRLPEPYHEREASHRPALSEGRSVATMA